MKIIITEEQKKKLFIPRRQSGEDSKWVEWNKEQPVKDGIRINQYTHDGLKTGIWWEFWKNGNIFSKTSYKDGKRDGLWETYDGNGNLRSKGLFKDGKEEGIWEFYYDDGKIDSRRSYKNGLKDGLWVEYYWDGDLYSKELYKNGILVKELPLTESEQPKKKLFIPRKIDERELEVKKKIREIINSEHFQDDLEQHIREWWPEISDFDEWLDENGWERDYINGDSYEQLGEEIADYIEMYHLIEFDYDLIDFSHYINNSELVINKLKDMGYL